MKPCAISSATEASGSPREHPDTGSAKPKAGTGGLLEAALTRQNLQRASRRVKANKGAAGVDGLDIEQTAHDLKLSNRPVRTRMPGGVAGVPPMMEAPYADSGPPRQVARYHEDASGAPAGSAQPELNGKQVTLPSLATRPALPPHR